MLKLFESLASYFSNKSKNLRKSSSEIRVTHQGSSHFLFYSREKCHPSHRTPALCSALKKIIDGIRLPKLYTSP